MALFSKIFKKTSQDEPEPVEEQPRDPVELTNTRFNLNDVLRDVANILAADAQDKRISIVYKIDKGVHSTVIGDRYKIANVLTEIIGNAIDFTNKREDVGVRIRRNEKNEDAMELHFEIRDHGVGIEDEAIKTILQPMLKSDRPAKAFGIEGLGLERARDVIHAMHGSITIDCEPKSGCLVKFFIQISAPDMKEKRHYRLPDRSGVGLKSLMVDDDAGSANALKTMLQYFRHEVTVGKPDRLDEAEAFDIVLVAAKFWSPTLTEQLSKVEKTRFVLIENLMLQHTMDEAVLDFIDWLIYKPFTQQFVFEMLSALYPASGEEAGKSPAKAEPDGIQALTHNVDAFLNGGLMTFPPEKNEDGICLCCKNAHQLFVAADGLHQFGKDYTKFIDALKEAIWKYVKADRIVGGLIEKGSLEKTASFCHEMKNRTVKLGAYKLACLCALLEDACVKGHTKDIEQLNNAFTYILNQSITSIDQFIDQAKYKVKS